MTATRSSVISAMSLPASVENSERGLLNVKITSPSLPAARLSVTLEISAPGMPGSVISSGVAVGSLSLTAPGIRKGSFVKLGLARDK
jgi:hypothetical protein